MIKFEDWRKIELKVGKITDVQDHPNADKLYIIKVDIGDKIIQLITGIRKYYTNKDLLGKKIIVLTNLETKIFRGIESNGMLLAAEDNNKISLLTVDKEISQGGIVR